MRRARLSHFNKVFQRLFENSLTVSREGLHIVILKATGLGELRSEIGGGGVGDMVGRLGCVRSKLPTKNNY